METCKYFQLYFAIVQYMKGSHRLSRDGDFYLDTGLQADTSLEILYKAEEIGQESGHLQSALQFRWKSVNQ